MTVYRPETTPLAGTMLLEASAGTGKTYALERMVSRLVGRDEYPLRIDQILVVTFTERAAREMRERIRGILVERSRESGRGDEERRKYRTALSAYDRAPIFTIHGFCRYVLRSWPFESGSPFEQELEPGGRLEEEEIRRYLAALDLSGWEKESYRAFRNVAGGLEGMVRLMVNDLTDETIPTGAVVVPDTDTFRTIREMADEFDSGGGELREAWAALIDGVWDDGEINQVLVSGGAVKKGKNPSSLTKIRSHVDACRLAAGFRETMDAIWGDPAGVKIGDHFKSLLTAARTAAAAADGNDAGLAARLVRFLDALGPLEDRDDPSTRLDRAALSWFFRLQAKGALRERVDRIKDETGIWDYSDLIRRVAEAVSREDGNSPLAETLRDRYRAALIDEFQDTDPRQWTLFRTLFDGPDHLLAMIGDPKQSIYGFRGTDILAYLRARQTVPENRRYRLSTNFRSRDPLVRSVNLLFSSVFAESEGDMAPEYRDVTAGRDDLPRLVSPGIDAAIQFVGVEGGNAADTRLAWSTGIVEEIWRLLHPDEGCRWRFDAGNEEPVSPADIAVLTETRATEEETLELLRGRGIPAVRFRSLSVFHSPASVVVEEFLETLVQPHMPAMWRSLLSGALFRIEPGLVERLESAGCIDELIEYGGEWRNLAEEGKITAVFDRLDSLAPVVGRWAAESGSGEAETRRLSLSWPARMLAETGGERPWTDFRHLVELLQERQAAGLRTPERLLEWLREARQRETGDGSDALRLEREDPAVKVMTIHAAKGLQFPLVFIHGGLKTGADGVRPDRWRYAEDRRPVIDYLLRSGGREKHRAYDWEERKRLWYVAVTRAVERAWLPRPLSGPFFAVESLYAAFDPGRPLGSGPVHYGLGAARAASEGRGVVDGILRGLAADYPDLFAVSPAPPAGSRRLPRPSAPEPRLAPLPIDDPLQRDERTESYTSLESRRLRYVRRNESPDDRDVDRFAEAPAGTGADIPLADDRGADFGTLMHALFEEIDFSVAAGGLGEFVADEKMGRFFETRCRRFAPAEWYPPRARELKELVWNTLQAPIVEDLRLCDIPSVDRKAEAEFLMTIPATADLRDAGGAIHVERGLFKGFIDLIIRRDRRWWVVDWKTNIPKGATEPDAYHHRGLEAMMEEHRYDIQYRFYLLALLRRLSRVYGRPIDWETEIGGALYLFVRGMRPSDSRGVFSAKPGLDEIRSWTETLGIEGALA